MNCLGCFLEVSDDCFSCPLGDECAMETEETEAELEALTLHDFQQNQPFAEWASRKNLGCRIVSLQSPFSSQGLRLDPR